MIGYFIDKAYFKHIDIIELRGKTYTSCYNHNYYYSRDYKCLILEECHEFENYNDYTLITKNKEMYLWEGDIEWFSDDGSNLIKIRNKDILK